MRFLSVILFVIFLYPNPLLAGECNFSETDYWMLGGFGLALAADYYTTRKALSDEARVHPDGTVTKHRETNPLLSDHPTSTELAAVSLLAGGAVLGVSCWLDDPSRKIFLGLAIAVEAEAAWNNAQLFQVRLSF